MDEGKKFAIENAGKRFRFGRRIVTVVGYRDKGTVVGSYVIVSHRLIGWRWNDARDLYSSTLLTKTKDKPFWYVFPEELKPL